MENIQMLLKQGAVGRPCEAIVKVGDKVLVSKYSGTDVKLEGVEYTILKEDDVLAVVE